MAFFLTPANGNGPGTALIAMVDSQRSRAGMAWLLSLLGSVYLTACGADDDGPSAAAGAGNLAGSGAGTVTGGAGTGSGTGTGGAGAAGTSTSSAGFSSSGSNAGGSSAGNGGASAGSGGGTVAGGGGTGTAGSAPEVSSEGDGDSEIGPTYTKDPNLTDLGKPKGKKFSFTMKSSDSMIFKGDDATLTKTPGPFQRSVTVYVPDQYKDGTEAPLLVIQDGPGPIDSISRALDNLTLSTDPLKKLPPFVAVAVQNGPADGQGSERGLEYDTMSDRYSRFIDTEVLPAVIGNAMVKAAYPGLKFTKDPDGRGAFGCSSGGAAALSMGWFATNLWHRIITYSGTFVDQQNHTQAEAMMMNLRYGAWEYHSDAELIKNTTPNKPLRIFVNANEMDLESTGPESGHHNWVMANLRTAAALKAKGYHYKYVVGKGVGHCAGQVQNQTIAEALSWAWRGYQAPK